MSFYTPVQFAIWRLVFGAYLLVQFAKIEPFAAEVYSSEGVFNDPSYNFTYPFFPNPLNYFDSPPFILLFIGFLSVLSFFVLVGIFRRPAALLLWFGWACLFNRNNLTLNPSLPYVGWLLLALSVIPSGEPLSLSKKINKDWSMPQVLYYGAWCILGSGYTYSGIAKLSSPSWLDGTAMSLIYQSPIAADSSIVSFMLMLPAPLLYGHSWAVLVIQIISLPLFLYYRTRFFGWLLMISLHIITLFLLDLWDVSFGILLFHWFVFDHRWIAEYRLNHAVELLRMRLIA